jgi:hypothetical protein
MVWTYFASNVLQRLFELGGSETDRGGLMRQKCFLVDALARLALNWKTDRDDWRERARYGAAG